MNYYNKYNQLGGVLNVYKGPMMQEGYGLGDIFKKFFKWMVPLVKKHAVPLLKSGAQTVGHEVLKSATNIAKDAIDGKNLSESADTNINAAVDTLKRKVEDTLEGNGIIEDRIIGSEKHVKDEAGAFNTIGNGIKKMKANRNFIILKKQKKNKSSNFNDIFD